MKAEVNGVTLEGTPKEIHEYVKLSQKKTVTNVKFNPTSVTPSFESVDAMMETYNETLSSLIEKHA